MKFTSKFGQNHCAILSLQGKRFKMFEMRFSKKHHTHDILILSLLLVIFMVYLLKVFNAEELHFLKSLKVNCSNRAYSLSMRPIFNNQC